MYVKVEVYPGAKKETIENIGEQRFVVTVKEPAEQNLANQRVREIMAQQYRVSAREVRIISGHHSSRKILSLPDPL